MQAPEYEKEDMWDDEPLLPEMFVNEDGGEFGYPYIPQ